MFKKCNFYLVLLFVFLINISNGEDNILFDDNLDTANIYYVSNQGNDNNMGSSISSPFRTIRKAKETMEDGDIIKLFPGTYEGPNNVGLDFRKNNVTIQSYVPEQPGIIDAEFIHPSCFEIYGNISIEGVVFKNCRNSIAVYSNILLKNNSFIGNEFGIHVLSSDIIIEVIESKFHSNWVDIKINGSFHDEISIILTNSTFQTPIGRSIYLEKSGLDLYIENCKFTEITNEIALSDGIVNFLAINSTFSFTGRSFSYGFNFIGSRAEFVNCNFNNIGSLFSFRRSIGSMTNCRVISSSIDHVNPIYIKNSNFTIDHCKFQNLESNTGIIYLESGNLSVKSTSFYNNTSSGSGGVITIMDGNVSFENTFAISNKAGWGGFSALYGGILEIKDSAFLDNQALFSGTDIAVCNKDISTLIIENTIEKSNCSLPLHGTCSF
eukprot:TRINITY_DN4071_c0_g2_i1.p1 TRINITY_DN4071_c0_g2~~TRINITY_DN4071_c0_g2_i1.p1  ORF type:complete len:437 (-),score=68.67 TRINITY_DN4071_c0_g2_i1:219-1529(-)